MKKILIITPNFPPESIGRGTRIFEMAKFLSNHHKVKIITPPPTNPFTKFPIENKLYKKDFVGGTDVTRLWTFQPRKSIPSTLQRLMYYLTFPTLCSIFMIIKFTKFSTVIIATPPPSVLLVTLTARLLRKRIIIDVGDLWESAVSLGSTPKFKSFRQFMKNFEINSWKKAANVIVNSKLVQKKMIDVLGTSHASKISYVPHNVDLNTFKKLNLETKNNLVYIGAYSYAYNFELLLKAIQIVVEEIPDLKIHFYGGGEFEDGLKKIIIDLKLENCCIVHNPVDRTKIPDILSKSKIGLIPLSMNSALQNVMPTKTLEFLACGLPVFAFGSSLELEKILNESKGGVFLKTDDYTKIASELSNTIKDEKKLGKLSQEGRKFAEQISGFTNLLDLI